MPFICFSKLIPNQYYYLIKRYAYSYVSKPCDVFVVSAPRLKILSFLSMMELSYLSGRLNRKQQINQ
jgi:hypothetical protein